MNRQLIACLPLIIAVASGAQAPPPAAPDAANSVTETSRISRIVPGPGDKPQGLLLRNGTFVTFSPGLAQRIPASLPKNARIQIVGTQFAREGSRSIDARTITIAGVAYSDTTDGLATGPVAAIQPGATVTPPPPPPLPPAGRGRPGPPPPSPCGAPPPPPAVDGQAPPPPPANDAPKPNPDGLPPAPSTPGAFPPNRQ